MNKWKFKLVLILTILGTIGIIALIPYSMTTLQTSELIPEGISLSFVMTVNTIAQVIQLFVMVLIGVRLQDRAGLGAPIFESLAYGKEVPKISGKWMLIGVVGSVIGSLAVILLDVFVFTPNIEMPSGQATEAIWWQGVLASFYGGITEELMLRLFVMTLIVWIIAVIFKKDKNSIPKSVYFTAIVLTALLFGLGHLPATAQLFGELTTILVVRALVLNGLLGLWFGFLYWKKGLEYAMVAHFSADIFLHVIFASMFG